MSQGGGQQSQSYNTGSLSLGQPYWNPYAQIFSNLSAQQQSAPQAPINNTGTISSNQNQTNQIPANTQQPSSTTASTNFNQAQNNIVAGLPAAGQQVLPQNINSIDNQATTQTASSATDTSSSPLTIEQWRAANGGAGSGHDYSQYLKGLGGDYYSNWIPTH